MENELSVIIISYNRKDLLKRCLDSVLGLDGCVKLEIIVIDQGSTDGSLDLVKDYQNKDKRLLLDIFDQKSLNAKRNRGLQLAKAPLVGFVDDDCILDRNWACACVSAFQQFQDIPLITGRILPLNEGFKRSVRVSVKSRTWGKSWFDRVIPWRCGCGNNFAVRKEFVNAFGMFDETIGAGTSVSAGGDDTEFFYRLLVRGYYIQYVPDMIVYHPQPTAFDEYKVRSEFYYKGIAVFIKKKYLKYPSAILMLIVRILHSLFFLFLGCISFRKDMIAIKYTEIRSTIRGLMQKD